MGHSHLTCFQSMTTFATTIIASSLKTHHGQSRHQHHSGEMDLDPRKASSAEQPAQPDVMNTSVESLQPPSEAQSIQGDTVVSSAPDATQITTDASATTEDETLESFKPLLLGQKGKTTSCVSQYF